MEALFCDDNAFIQDPSGLVYSSAQFPYSLWRRYLKAFDRITVAGRCRALQEHETIATLNVSSGPGIDFIFLPNLASLAGLITRRRFEAAAILKGAMAGVDAVIARLPSEIGFLAAKLALNAGKPLAVEVAACPWDQLWNHGTWQGKLYAPVCTWRMRHTVQRSPFILYVSREFLQRRYPTQGSATSVSDVEIGPLDQAVLTRRIERIGRGKEHIVFGLIGSLQHRYKGIHTALEALGRTREELRSFELRLLGPGESSRWRAEAARHGLAGRVRFCGALPSGQAVLDWLDEVDVYLQPSFQEGLPRALIEAMSRGCPAIASTAGGIPELLPAACLHRPGDASRLGELMVQAAYETGWQAAQARQNFEMAKQYAADILDARRTAFWQRFARYAGQRAKLSSEPRAN